MVERMLRPVLLVLLVLLVVAGDDAAAAELLKAEFSAAEADDAAVKALGQQRAFLDTRVPARGQLVVFLHGAGSNESCGPAEHLRLLAGYGFHVFSPCYVADYGVENCGSDIRGCRLEAFEGIDHHPYVQIAPADGIERRIARGLRHLDTLQPEARWGDFLADADRPDWTRIVLTGHSHGASTAALIGKVRRLDRIVMLAGPYDPDQAWLAEAPLTAVDRYYGLSHVGDPQHPGHLAAFAALGLPGPVVDVDRAAPPYGDSHRLITAVASDTPHSAVRAGSVSPRVGASFALEPAWRYLYGVGE
jgi:hypothetical protein